MLREKGSGTNGTGIASVRAATCWCLALRRSSRARNRLKPTHQLLMTPGKRPTPKSSFDKALVLFARIDLDHGRLEIPRRSVSEAVMRCVSSLTLFKVAFFSRVAATASSLGHEPQENGTNDAHQPRSGDRKRSGHNAVAPSGLSVVFDFKSWGSRPRLHAAVPPALAKRATSKLMLRVRR